MKRISKIAVAMILSAGMLFGALPAGAARVSAVPFGVSAPNINIMNYGAKADGTTSDQDAFVKAFDAAGQAGLPLYLPAGTYNLAGLTIWSAPYNVTIYGDGAGKTILEDVVEIQFNANATLSNFSITKSAGDFIYINPTSPAKVSVTNVDCKGIMGDTTTSFIYGDIIQTPVDLTVTGCKVTDVNRAVCIYGNVSSATITDCDFENLGSATAQYASGVFLGNNEGTKANNVLIQNNVIKNLYTYVSPDTDDDSQYSRAYGILVYGTKNIEISGNHVENVMGGNAHSGIYTKAPEAKILNNEVIDAGDGGGSIINKALVTTDYEVKGNTIRVDKVPLGGSIFNCIYFCGTNIDIENNDIELFARGIGIEFEKLDGSVGLKSATIKNNTINTSSYYALYLSNAVGSISITKNNISIKNAESVQDASAFAFCDTSSDSSFDISKNSVSATDAKIINTWNIASNTKLRLASNTFVESTASLGQGLSLNNFVVDKT